jgi:acyl-CoA reductase-like NAD-dependent aldehyde dehydrogenase
MYVAVNVKRRNFVRTGMASYLPRPASGGHVHGSESLTPIFVAGTWAESPDKLVVTRPGSGTEVGTTFLATAEQYEVAVLAACAATGRLAAVPSYERSATLYRVAELIRAHREELGQLLCGEAGKPIRDALTEVERSALVFQVAAEEVPRLTGDYMPLDINQASRGRFGVTRRFPNGPIAGISPFNLPLSLSVHKVAPAMAVGAPIVLKVPSAAPLTMLAVARLIEEAGAPPGSLSVLPMSRQLGDQMVTDDRFKVLSFTGSPAVGWNMKARAGRKKVVLELGGNAGAIVDASADLQWAATRCAAGAFKYAGQTCISVQRVFVHEQVWDEFADLFVQRAAALRQGDPADPETDLGPMIDEAAAIRIEEWVADAVAAGGRVLLGGPRNGAWYPPTVLADVPDSARVCRDEAFAPVAALTPVHDFDEAIQRVNDSAFGLQAGVFTADVWQSWRAFEQLEVGGVILNDSPTYRVDHMPYGGVKDSGLGREGIRYAMEDMTELRLLVVAMPS